MCCPSAYCGIESNRKKAASKKAVSKKAAVRPADRSRLSRGVWMSIELLALPALVVGKKDEAPVVHLLQQHHTGGGGVLVRNRSKNHGVGLRNLAILGVFEPVVKQLERILGCVRFQELSGLVIFS